MDGRLHYWKTLPLPYVDTGLIIRVYLENEHKVEMTMQCFFWLHQNQSSLTRLIKRVADVRVALLSSLHSILYRSNVVLWQNGKSWFTKSVKNASYHKWIVCPPIQSTFFCFCGVSKLFVKKCKILPYAAAKMYKLVGMNESRHKIKMDGSSYN